jgi:hypothetical protein
MLDLKNVELVSRWLQLRPEGVSAAVFVNDRDELSVYTADGTIELLDTSPFKHQRAPCSPLSPPLTYTCSHPVDKCIVYLDDAHTRGTDLKLPRNTRAAVTLGPKVTKDRLVQGRALCDCFVLWVAHALLCYRLHAHAPARAGSIRHVLRPAGMRRSHPRRCSRTSFVRRFGCDSRHHPLGLPGNNRRHSSPHAAFCPAEPRLRTTFGGGPRFRREQRRQRSTRGMAYSGSAELGGDVR